MPKLHQFASESVCAGHPDKVCDQISDAVLDAAIKQDPGSRIAVETVVCHDRTILAGEITTSAKLDVERIVRTEVKRLGYVEPKWGFSDQSPVSNYLHQQSPEIGVGVDADGAGDQGMMFGYACHETPELMPLPITLAHELTKTLDAARESNKLPYLRPDGKAQVVVNYEDDRPVGVAHVTIAVPHDESIGRDEVKNAVYEKLITPVLEKYGYAVAPTDVMVNGTGIWHQPGPSSDAGLTGRKIIVDSYGGYARVGGGAFSGKDPSKVDRSGAYAARYIAKNLVAHGLAERAEVALAYYIGAKEPVMLSIDTFGTATASAEELQAAAKRLINPTVREIIEKLDLRRPIYKKTAAYGHFGRPDFPWEQIVATL